MKDDSKEIEFVRVPPASFQFVVGLKSSLWLFASIAVSFFGRFWVLLLKEDVGSKLI